MEDIIIGGFVITPYAKILLALLLGALIGTERSLAHKHVGLRTFSLVSMGACMFVVAALDSLPTLNQISNPDLLRVVSGVVTGVGFLGAGVIIFRENTVKGITTAAAVWIAAGIGVMTGLGFYALAIFSAFLTLVVFTLFWFLEREVEEITD